MAREATVRQARALRRRSSMTERLLWDLLRDRRLEGLKFRRQVPMGPYILDFVCFSHRLAVEADGPFHDAEYDAHRDRWLAARGFRVLRFSNGDIRGSDFKVISRIAGAAGVTPQIGQL